MGTWFGGNPGHPSGFSPLVANPIQVNSVICPITGTIDGARLYCRGMTGIVHAIALIYASGISYPTNALLGQSNPLTIPASDPAGYKAFTFPPTPVINVVSGTQYYLGVLTDASLDVGFNSGGSGGYNGPPVAYPNPSPNPFYNGGALSYEIDFGVGVSIPTIPVTAFTWSKPSLPSLVVSFQDVTSGVPTSWDWDFGDGSAHSTVQNPSHTYATAGTYTVTLTATNSLGSASRSYVIGAGVSVSLVPRAPEAPSAKTSPMAAWAFTRMTKEALTWQMVKSTRLSLEPDAWKSYLLPTGRGTPASIPLKAKLMFEPQGDSVPQAGGITVY